MGRYAFIVAATCLVWSSIGCGSNRAPSSTIGGAGTASSGNGSGGTNESGGAAGTGGASNGGGSAGFDDLLFNNGGSESSGCRTVDSCEADECGPIADGCGQLIECGSCEAPETCGGGGVPSRCGTPSTGASVTCESAGIECGQYPDGRGGVLECGSACAGAGELCIEGQCTVAVECTPLTCDDYTDQPGLCGPVTDGCGGTLDCSFTCGANETCGAVQPSQCGASGCTPLTCEQALADKPAGYCGFVSDGCGGSIEGCATVCVAPETCAGGPAPQDGSSNEICGSGGGSCTPLSTSDCGAVECGFISDGCGDVVACGTCDGGEECIAGTCTATGTCTPYTCQSFGAECGSMADGCGGTLDCGSCSGGESCGGGGTPNVCGSAGCTPLSDGEACTNAGAGFCGNAPTGCGEVTAAPCNTCTAPETCGGGGVANFCGEPACTPQTCQQLGATCGPQGDGCGGVIQCGTCGAGLECVGVPSSCQEPVVPCTNFCESQATCPQGQQTRVTGKVYAPNGIEPLYNALVYVPNIQDLNNLPAITTGPSCERCEDEDLGEPLVATFTAADGSFVLEDVPAAVDFPLVVKMGKWRRVVTIPAVAACSENVLSVNDARLPRHMADAEPGLVQHVNIPQFAMVTGEVDAIECVLRKIGVDDTEFTGPAGSGRIHLYRGDDNGDNSGGANGAQTPGGSTGVGTLFTNDNLSAYDVAIFDCEGPSSKTDNWRSAVEAFGNAGGRIFASHYSYNYLEGNTSYNNTATWDPDGEYLESGLFTINNNPTTGIIDTSHSKAQAFNEWLGHVGAHHSSYGEGYISIIDPRGYVASVDPNTTERFVFLDADHVVPGYSGTGPEPNGDINDYGSVQQYAFNTPVGASAQNSCGRVVYSAFHVAGETPGSFPNHSGATFPDHCDTGPLTPQEKVLEFMIFDLSACVSTSNSCTPLTCGDQGADCGYVSDGCGGLLDCGTCGAGEVCGATQANQCDTGGCTLETCGSAGANCGAIPDGCGGTLNCGTCDSPATCGGGGTPNVCGTPVCTPRSCASVGAECGALADGCGATLECGSCPSGEVCGAAGPNQCGQGSCTPQTCQAAGAECGNIGDGCGGIVNCGSCPGEAVCGAGGPNQCGSACAPTTCNDAGANCGFIADGCGGTLNCGTCPSGQVCGAAGPNQCGGSCTLTSCASEGAECGNIGDGCGGVLDCGDCPPSELCGGAGPNQCGTGACTPSTECGSECGIISDGCGGVLSCPPCQGSCEPLTCADLGINCGPAGDGCGGLLDCGTCSNGNWCGGGGPSLCGGAVQ